MRKNNVLMRGEKSEDNCYMWSPKEASYSSTWLMTKEESKVCEEWQIGKQTKMSEPKLRNQTTSKVLELLSDQIGRIQVESPSGKRNTHMVVDDYSRFVG